MKEKVKKIIAINAESLAAAIESEDFKEMAESLKFINQACQVYVGYISLDNYEPPEGSDQH